MFCREAIFSSVLTMVLPLRTISDGTLSHFTFIVLRMVLLFVAPGYWSTSRSNRLDVEH